jgi:hypothetical protein
MPRRSFNSQIHFRGSREFICDRPPYVLRTVSQVFDVSFERRISALHAKPNCNFGNSFKRDRNNFLTVSEWKAFCEHFLLLPFRSPAGVMCDIPNKLMLRVCTQQHQIPIINIQYVLISIRV